MKDLNYYKYETPKITILWKGITQPMGFFYSAIAANKAINDIYNSMPCNFELYKIQTPDGILTPIRTL